MRRWLSLVVLPSALAAMWPSPAVAGDHHPEGAASAPTLQVAAPDPGDLTPLLRPPARTFDAGVPRVDVAGLGPLTTLPVSARYRGYRESRPLRIAGTVITSLGGAVFFAAGITAILATVSADDLQDECPGKICVEETRGGDMYHRARDTARATDWLVGIGAPVFGSGIVMLLYSAVLERSTGSLQRPPIFRAGPTGASLTVHF